jgi:hypothetical protein
MKMDIGFHMVSEEENLPSKRRVTDDANNTPYI